jgi:hypothetical protein
VQTFDQVPAGKTLVATEPPTATPGSPAR